MSASVRRMLRRRIRRAAWSIGEPFGHEVAGVVAEAVAEVEGVSAGVEVVGFEVEGGDAFLAEERGGVVEGLGSDAGAAMGGCDVELIEEGVACVELEGEAEGEDEVSDERGAKFDE